MSLKFEQGLHGNTINYVHVSLALLFITALSIYQNTLCTVYLVKICPPRAHTWSGECEIARGINQFWSTRAPRSQALRNCNTHVKPLTAPQTFCPTVTLSFPAFLNVDLGWVFPPLHVLWLRAIRNKNKSTYK